MSGKASTPRQTYRTGVHRHTTRMAHARPRAAATVRTIAPPLLLTLPREQLLKLVATALSLRRALDDEMQARLQRRSEAKNLPVIAGH